MDNIKICQEVHYKLLKKKSTILSHFSTVNNISEDEATVAVCTFSLYVCKNGHHDITSISST